MLIGLTGPARCGKDTVARMICDIDANYEKYSFATPIKQMLMTGFELTNSQVDGDAKDSSDLRYNCTVRHLMQTLGTEWGRNLIHEDIWLINLQYRLRNETCAVVSDVRFENEAKWVRETGRLIHITGRGGIPGSHASENQVEYNGILDYNIHNSGSEEQLHNEVLSFMQLVS